MSAVQEERVAEDLGDLAAGPPGDFIGGLVAIEPGGVAELHLDQLVVDERLLHRGDQAVIDAALADLYDRLQFMAQAAEVTTLLAGQHGLFVARKRKPPGEFRAVWKEPSGGTFRTQEMPRAA